MNNQLDKKILELGKAWGSAGAKRAYFNDLESIYGLEFKAAESGRVISVLLDGEEIPLAKGLLLRAKFAMARVWFNFEKSTFHYENLDPVLANHILDTIRKQISEAN